MKPRPTLKSRFLKLGVVIAVVKVAVAATLVWASVHLSIAMRHEVESRECALAAYRAVSALSHHRRHMLLWKLTGEASYLEEAAGYRQSAEADLLSSICTKSPEQKAMGIRAQNAAAEYLSLEKAERIDNPRHLLEAERGLREKFSKAHVAFDQIVAMNAEASRLSADQAEEVQSVTRQLGAFIGLGSFSVIFGGFLTLRRQLILPLSRLASSIRGVERSKAIGAPLGLGLEAELGDIEKAVDELSSTVAEQRSAQHRFVAAVAHELKNPLQSIRGYCSLVRDDKPLPPEPVLRQGFRIIDRQVDKLTRQLDDLLDAAHIQSGALSLQIETIQLHELVSEAQSMFGTVSGKHRIEVDIAHSLELRGDPFRLSQVLTNLLSNAVKYSPAGGCVTVCLRRDRDEAVISIADEGIGIDPEQMARLFEPFRRGERVRGLEIPGVGLGLSTSRRIVEAHGGRIEVESEVGSGSTFIVRLPLFFENQADVARLSVTSDFDSHGSSTPPAITPA